MRTALSICALATLTMLAGCRLFGDNAVVQGKSPLRPARPSPDSVTLEIVWARFPRDDAALNHAMWREIDETQIDPAVRRELTHNGFRAGVIAGTPPEAILRALDFDAYQAIQQAKHAADDADEADGSDTPSPAADLLTEPEVQQRLLQLRRGRRAEIQASETLASMPLLVSRGRELGGRTYRNAQAIYALQVDPRPNWTVGIELTPELHFGEPRVRWSGGDEGILRPAPIREREVFDALRMNVRLSPGEMLVLMSLPEAGSRLGHYFHTTNSAEGRQQKLVLVRLAQVPSSDVFDAADPP